MHFRRATAHWPRPPRLPRVHAPRLHQPALHLTVMVATAAVVTAVATATPALQGSFVGSHTPSGPAAMIAAGPAGTTPDQQVYGAPTSTTSVAPPPHTIVGPGAGNISTVLFSDPNGKQQIGSPLAADGIPVTALEAYQDAANAANATDPGCHIPWPLLAGIGRVESDHGRYGGAILRPDGTSTRPIIGIPLNGNGTEVVLDTDHGTIDGDPVYDRAVGPMQFIPSTWLIYGADGNGDGIKDPFNIFDAAAAAAHYLCVAGGDLSTTAGQTRAVLSYNHSTAYLAEVLGLEHVYASGDPGLIIPAAPTVVPPVPEQGPGGQPVPPPVNPGPPLSGGTSGSTGTGSQGGTKHPGSGSTSSSKPGPSQSSGSSAPGGGPGPGSSSTSSGNSSGNPDPGPSSDSSAPGNPAGGSQTDTGNPGDPSTSSDPAGGSTQSDPAGGGSSSAIDSSTAAGAACPTPTDTGTSGAAATDTQQSTAADANTGAAAATNPDGGAGTFSATAADNAVAGC